MGGVFERFPKLRFILTESGCAWAPGLMRQLDGMYMAWKAGAIGEIDTSKDPALKELPSFYAKRNCWYGASFPGPRRTSSGRDDRRRGQASSGATTTRTTRAAIPYSREKHALRLRGRGSSTEVRMMLGENAAALYGFDLEKLRPAAEGLGITPSMVATPLDEIPADSACPTFQRARYERQRAAQA